MQKQILCIKLTSNSQSVSFTRTKIPGLLDKQNKFLKFVRFAALKGDILRITETYKSHVNVTNYGKLM